MTQRPAAGKPLYYGDKDCNFSELFLFKSSTSASKKNINAKQIGMDQDGWLFNTYFRFTIFQFRSQCPLQELNSFPLDNSQLVHHQRKPDVPWLVSAEPHLAAASSQQVAGDPSQPTWGSNYRVRACYQEYFDVKVGDFCANAVRRVFYTSANLQKHRQVTSAFFAKIRAFYR